MKRRELTIHIDASRDEWDEFLAEIERAEMQLAQLELEQVTHVFASSARVSRAMSRVARCGVDSRSSQATEIR